MPQAVADPGVADPVDPISLLSEVLRRGSREVHRAAESSAFLQRLMSGRLEPADYLAYLERLSPVYAALEQAVHQHRDDPVLRVVHDDRLARSGVLASDVRHWRDAARSSRRAAARPDASPAGPAGPAAAAYQARILRAGEQPWLLLAHHYTRYLGDLSGGQVMRRRLAETFGGQEGLAFYDFASIPDAVSYKRGYRARLDQLVVDPVRRAALLAEVCTAFDCIRALLAELD